MRNFVQETNCKRQFILHYFGYNVEKRSLPDHTCCDGHKCTCDDCLLSDVLMLFNAFETSSDVLPPPDPPSGDAQIDRDLYDYDQREIEKDYKSLD